MPGAVHPARHDIGRSALPSGDVLRGDRELVPGSSHPLKRRATVLARVAEVVMRRHVVAVRLRRGGQPGVDGQRSAAGLGPFCVRERYHLGRRVCRCLLGDGGRCSRRDRPGRCDRCGCGRRAARCDGRDRCGRRRARCGRLHPRPRVRLDSGAPMNVLANRAAIDDLWRYRPLRGINRGRRRHQRRGRGRRALRGCRPSPVDDLGQEQPDGGENENENCHNGTGPSRPGTAVLAMSNHGTFRVVGPPRAVSPPSGTRVASTRHGEPSGIAFYRIVMSRSGQYSAIPDPPDDMPCRTGDQRPWPAARGDA